MEKVGLNMSSGLGLRILCVEDDPPILNVLGQALAAEGYEVAQASSAEEALGYLSQSHFDLLVSDYQLPKKDGIKMIEEATQAGWLSGTKSLLISAYPMVFNPLELPILKKPLDLDRFLAKVDDLLATARERMLTQTTKEISDQSQAAKEHAAQIELTLYTSGASPSSLRAIRNLRRILREHQNVKVELEICDLSREVPLCADEDRIAFTPTLVKRFPEPKAWLLGSLDEPEPLIELLQAVAI